MSKNHFYDNSTHIRYPDTIKVEEKRAPTDESVKLLKEVQEQTIQNLITHVKVENNLVNGECFAVHIPWDITGEKVRLFFKVKINGEDFTIEREVERRELWNNGDEIGKINQKLKELGKAVLLWYILRHFTTQAFEQITGEPLPDYYKEKLLT